MATRMLIDATHDEETRVVIVKGTRLEEFDYETASKKQLKGNIYLAKVTRVEPSLQAAFVEYGGNRHGFLPFSEIHPDYYQIPVSDREELIEQESVAEKEALSKEDEDEDEDTTSAAPSDTDDEPNNSSAKNSETSTSDEDDEEGVVDDEDDTLGGLETVGDDEDDSVENIGGEDDVDLAPKVNVKRHYKIQEVIKRRQILLVQVVKEERGNKGAALTTYISLPGRYSVLMPNTGRGGGISRKISNPADRKRLKKIATELDVPDGIGVIIRTAGLNRTKVEIRRDYEFLMRLWDDIRETTLKSIAPCCVYEEANLIKRSIRDLYSKEVSEILIEGDNGYRIAKDFMRKLMPSHAKKVQPYRDRIPLFHRFQVEQQFASMYLPEVHLKSGGYIVINPTEALVSIDVNSGKATKERSIEETALKTNLEAAEEISRQLRLRDLAGLIVIDFIDMDDNRNNKAVERRMKDCLKSDRARIQVGRISPFGLMEMSRQRLRPSFLEASTNICHTCGGSGFVRSIESTALLIIRALEEEGVRERSAKITITVHTDVAIYLLNQKRGVIQELEGLYGLTIVILADPTTNLNDHQIERERGKPNAPTQSVLPPAVSEPEEEDETTEETADNEESESNSAKRRRRRRRRKPRDDADGNAENAENAETSEENESDKTEAKSEETDEEPRKRRRGKRGGRRRSRQPSSENGDENQAIVATENPENQEVLLIPITMPETDEGGIILKSGDSDEPSDETPTQKSEETSEEAEKPKTPRRRRPRTRKKPDTARDDTETVSADAPATEAEASTIQQSTEEAPEEQPEKVRPRRRRSPRKKSGETAEPASEANVETSAVATEAVVTTVSSPVVEGETAPAEASVKPKRTRARKEKVETPSVANTPEVKAEPVITEVPETSPVSSEPEETAKPKGPRRSGWWRRKS
ncbi:ribonuclease E/G [Sneathiella aquimaris]|uniref:ribonuclease E/G n=1 Tax=Sneathiella aquimaris TaxID=2599305 RepID=UPI00146CBC5C|nr:ribonuclease E/G [Sneathiella aquimaris]